MKFKRKDIANKLCSILDYNNMGKYSVGYREMLIISLLGKSNNLNIIYSVNCESLKDSKEFVDYLLQTGMKREDTLSTNISIGFYIVENHM